MRAVGSGEELLNLAIFSGVDASSVDGVDRLDAPRPSSSLYSSVDGVRRPPSAVRRLGMTIQGLFQLAN